MKIRLAYGTSGLDVTLPDGVRVDVIQPTHVAAPADQAGAVRNALRNPIGFRPLRELVKRSDTLCIVCNDITRPTPYHTILLALLEEISHVPDEAIVVLIATGTHRPCTRDELKGMLGDEIIKRFRIVQNDARDRPTHALAGTTASGNEIWLHTEYLHAEVRILTGFIEPHFFAGFSGGGKACMPGMALLETIVRNHNPRNIDHPMATWGVTHGNPIWEEVREAALMTPSSFLLNVALNREKQITGVFAGDLERAHEGGCEFVRTHAMVSVDTPYDIVITSNSGYPLDLSLYQAVKGMSAAARIVKAGGAIILAADCWDGVPNHGQYKKLLFEADSPASLLDTIRAGGGHDCWQAQIHASICEKAEVYLFSQNLSDEEIRRAMLKPCRSIAETVERLLPSLGPDASICVLPEGPQTIPCLKEKRP